VLASELHNTPLCIDVWIETALGTICDLCKARIQPNVSTEYTETVHK
jgi:hypothetical protein